jgi:cellulase/cellobiase CelA1
MRRSAGVAGLIVLAVGLAVGAGAGPALASPAPAASACAGIVQINSLVFAPAAVTPGQSATATLVAQNCTSQSLQTSTVWFGRFVGSGTGIPAGCPAIDPIARPATFPPSGQVTVSTGYLVFANCTATDLQVTVRITGADGGVLAEQTADLTIGAAAPACSVSYLRQSEWAGGFVAGVTVTNNGATAIDGWSLTFAFPGDQRISGGWNAVLSQAGAVVTATDRSYNRRIAAGGQAWFGFVGTWQTSDASPAGGFTLNGVTCAVG